MKLYNEKYGQVLLRDKNIANIEVSFLDEGGDVLEIGPGDGFITQLLLDKYSQVTVVESDHRFVDILRVKFYDYIDSGQLNIIHGDFLEYEAKEHSQIIGNVPYHISSKIIQKLATMRFNKAILMFQNEFAQTLLAKPETKQYTRMTIFSYINFEMEFLKKVSKNSFYPVPRVESAIISLKKIKKFNSPSLPFAEERLRTLFSQKRKKLKNVLNNCPIEYMDHRIDQLAPDTIVNLMNSNFLEK
jgi:16S rRNA (adenine1518-N6/adenine1519-N6)-dimethyltransferase